MILADTSVWIDHLRQTDDMLVSILNSAQVVMHPMIIGELACGNLKNRVILLDLLKKLPAVRPAQNDEVLYFIEHNQLMGRGIGFVDAHLLASLALNSHIVLWTRDKRLDRAANQLGLAFKAD
ncbi:type II toxin-antitoxin system VapC family toxin [Desulfobulbus sp. US1]|nr:type II toxin-antitoxin system VapC family toxin [Desulfobulbus sp. US4]MCW5209377.1 type II toxin-antitoxin system VapC family toxin [Desulfobulbus sp. US1]